MAECFPNEKRWGLYEWIMIGMTVIIMLGNVGNFVIQLLK